MTKAIDFPLTVVLGDPHERYTADLSNHIYTICLDRWDAAQFAAFSMGIAIQFLVPKKQRTKIVSEILLESLRMLPVSAGELKSNDRAVSAPPMVPASRTNGLVPQGRIDPIGLSLRAIEGAYTDGVLLQSPQSCSP